MKKCVHMGDMKSMKSKIGQIRSMSEQYSERKATLCCKTCKGAKDLWICCVCGEIYCKNDWDVLAKNKIHNHSLSYDLLENILSCKECGVSLNIGELKSLCPLPELFNYYVLKAFSNLGGTTHMNSILQMMVNLAPFRTHFLGFHHSQRDCKVPRCANCFFKNIYSQIYTLEPANLCKNVFTLAEINRSTILLPDSSIAKLFDLICNLYHSQISDVCECIMHKLFFGTQNITTTCIRCRYVATQKASFNHLVLKCNHSLDAALQQYFSPQLATQSTYCSQCKSHCPVYKTITIEQFPKVLSFFFKRFTPGLVKRKINCKINIEHNVAMGNKLYSLYGFIEHKGINRCSYITYLRLQNVWYEFTDEKIIRDLDISFRLHNATVVFYILHE